MTDISKYAQFFKNNTIPPYFHVMPNDSYGLTYMKTKPEKTFFLRPSNSEPDTCLSITYKTHFEHIQHIKIIKQDDYWFTIWEHLQNRGTNGNFKNLY